MMEEIYTIFNDVANVSVDEFLDLLEQLLGGINTQNIKIIVEDIDPSRIL